MPFANTKQSRSSGHALRSLEWQLPFRMLFCCVILLSIFFSLSIPTFAACSCSPSEWIYSKYSQAQHYVSCDDCGMIWRENHQLVLVSSKGGCAIFQCKLCEYTKTSHTGTITYIPAGSNCLKKCDKCNIVTAQLHVYEYQYINKETCMKSCENCKTASATGHKLTINEYPATETEWAYRVTTCTQCKYEDITQISPPLGQYATTTNPDNYTSPDISTDVDLDSPTNMNDFAWNAYKLLCVITIPVAIISLAFCGFKFLGSIFFGTYLSGGEVEKVRKQVVYTLLFVALLLLLPSIFRATRQIFESTAWKP